MVSRTLTVVARSSVVEDGTIVTAVAGLSEKVGGSGTQFGVPEPLQRSVHQRPWLRRQQASSLRVEEFFFNRVIGPCDYGSARRTDSARRAAARATSERVPVALGSTINFKALDELF